MKITIYSKRLIKILFDHLHFTNQFQSFRWFINIVSFSNISTPTYRYYFSYFMDDNIKSFIRSKVTWPKTWPGYGRMRIWTQVWIVLVISTTFQSWLFPLPSSGHLGFFIVNVQKIEYEAFAPLTELAHCVYQTKTTIQQWYLPLGILQEVVRYDS